MLCLSVSDVHVIAAPGVRRIVPEQQKNARQEQEPDWVNPPHALIGLRKRGEDQQNSRDFTHQKRGMQERKPRSGSFAPATFT
jgi:hypothetical protein